MTVRLDIGKYSPFVAFAVLTLAVLLPLMAPGFILTLDMVFTPHIHLPLQVTSSYLFYALLHYLNFIIPADVLQKSILASIIFLSSLGGYKLVERTTDRTTAAQISAYVAGILYAINPYTYERFMAGQFAVLLGYCLLPFVAIQLLILAEHPTWRRGLGLGLLLTITGIVSIHTLGLASVLLLIMTCSAVWQRRSQPQQIKHYMVNLLLALCTFAIASAYWLVPTLAGTSSTATAIAGFAGGDDQAFATLGGGFVGQILHILRLQGFWAESMHLFVLPQAFMPGWWMGVCILWIIIGVGIAAAWKGGRRQMAVIYISAAFTGAILATGVFNSALSHIFPLFRGFREPQKFAGLVALSYAVLVGWGVTATMEYFSRKRLVALQQLALATALLLPIVLTPTMFWGFGKQLQPVQYPATWAAINNQLDRDKSSYQVLFLPWHLYMYYRFADRIIMSPAAGYFDKPIIASNNPEIGQATADRPDARKTLLGGKILPNAANKTNLGAQLANLHIKYIILDKDNDFTSYAYLAHQVDLRLVSESANLRLYLNTEFKR